MAENDAIAALTAEVRALTGQMQRNERVTAANNAAQSANTGAPSNNSGGAAPSFGAPGAAPSPPRFANYSDRQQFTKILGAGFGALAGTASAISVALPTTQEAVDVQLLADRMKFYGGAGSRAGAMTSQLRASLMGTATSPEDSALASNYAAQRGLMPGLSNFGAGANYAGIMGGAALASNLTPGLGIAGGVGVMASLNDPKMVNMARMFGIQMRNKEGTGMIDLPQIIKQLYDILAKSGPVTPENIAISVMPGNALDSILNQYFGLDPNVRSTVISGLTQMAANNGDMAFSKSSLIASGAMSEGVRSTGNRASGELRLLQKFSENTVKNLIGSNNILNGIYGGMVNATGTAATLIKGVGSLGTTLETLGGARNGAGQLLIDSMFDTTGALLGLPGKAGKLFGLATIAGVGKKGFDTFKNGFGTGTAASPYFTGDKGYNAFDSVSESKPGQMFTGAITINVSGGVDQYNIASAISDALSRAM